LQLDPILVCLDLAKDRDRGNTGRRGLKPRGYLKTFLNLGKVFFIMKNLKITIIGTGALGMAIAHQLKKHGFNLLGIAARNTDSSKLAASIVNCEYFSIGKIPVSDVYILAVPDKAIERVAKIIVRARRAVPLQHKIILIHLSGCLSSDILKISKYCYAAAAHPIGSFKHFATAVKTIQNVFWTLEGDKSAVEFMKSFIKNLSGKYYEIDKKEKPLYHTACTIASSGLLSLIYASCNMLNTVGAPHVVPLQNNKNTLQILWPLISSSLENLQSSGFPAGATGPWSRKDKKTIKTHKDALKNYDKNTLKLYKLLGSGVKKWDSPQVD